METQEKEKPRNYQMSLMKIAIEQNTIIFLPTGSGKTFIAVMVLKQLSGDLSKPYSEGGKITFLLVNTIALVPQHAKYIRNYTNFDVGCYTGEMNLDGWEKADWEIEFNKFQVFIMTSQILMNIILSNFIDVNKINLLIFDECHKGVVDHSMRQIMKSLGQYPAQPRILGLTATILNGNCKLGNVMSEVRALEVTYNSKVATVDALQEVVGFSTNPREIQIVCKETVMSEPQKKAIYLLQSMITTLQEVHIFEATNVIPISEHLKPFSPSDILRDLRNLINILIIHIEMLGTFGGLKACLVQMIKLERIKKHCQDFKMVLVLNGVLTTFACVRQILVQEMKNHTAIDQIYKFSTDKVLQLFEILKNFKNVSQQELCGLVFVKQRFTARILFHILESFRQYEPTCHYIKSNFMVGNQNNPYNDTRENLYISKKNREILDSFVNKEFNLLFCSNVLEEGVDIPCCTLVIRFDKSEDYRSYIQTKGRARHKLSIFYTIIEQRNYGSYMQKYSDFQEIEKLLNDFLVGKNLLRSGPSQDDVDGMYNEDLFPPFFVNGPQSAHVSMTSSVALLSRYCMSLPSDPYTTYTPEFYLDLKNSKVRVIIVMPTPCPIKENIIGPFLNNKKDAKRAAALKACIALYKCGELDDSLLSYKAELDESDVSYLFEHWPEVKEENTGVKKRKRLYNKQMPPWIKGRFSSNSPVYLHIIKLNPTASSQEDYNNEVIQNLYLSSRCFGLVTAKPLPRLCRFPIFTSTGQIDVIFEPNVKTISLTEEELLAIKEFHFLIFNDVLEILKPFLIFDNSGNNSDMLLVVPLHREDNYIDFKTIYENKTIKTIQEPTSNEKYSINVTEEEYLYKIVFPWYRNTTQTYLVTNIFHDKTPLSNFPNLDYANYVEYYQEKYSQSILKRDQPLILVKGLSSRLNMFKPPGVGGKRKKEKRYDELSEHLIPELVVKQDFPADLWVQSKFLPTILSRITYLLRLLDLQSSIAKSLGANQKYLNACPALQVDYHLLDYEAIPPKPRQEDIILNLAANSDLLSIECPSLLRPRYNKDYASKMLEAEYHWKNIEEPKDIERDLNVTIMEIEIYENFICQKVSKEQRLLKNVTPKKVLPAITYEQKFVEKSLSFFSIEFDNQIPNLCEFYSALTTAEANDIVNLERLEVLGDSFLKLISSLYILFKFPDYNEGKSTTLKGKLVSNKNLYYLARRKNLGGILRNSNFAPKEEWVPPCFCLPEKWKKDIENKKYSVSSAFYANVPISEQVSGNVSQQVLDEIRAEEFPIEEDEENSYTSMCHFLNKQYVADKTMADGVEALLGAYFQSGGFKAGVKFVEWIGIIPASENLQKIIDTSRLEPIINKNCNLTIAHHLPQWKKVEQKLGYKFNNPNYLLQALTHSSYSMNRLTNCYERLEFVGDAILDFLITCYIYEHCGNLNPGQVTDLRSALVNNNTFASLAVRNNFHKDLLLMNMQLQKQVEKFVNYFTMKDYVIDDEVFILLEEEDVNLAEYIDVPKILGDVFEALAGAVYLDSGNDLNAVWKVFYRLMWKEMDLFSKNVPKNILRRLYECHTAYPTFGDAILLSESKKTMVALSFMCEGRRISVHGFGSNKNMAKKAAAKIALRSLNF